MPSNGGSSSLLILAPLLLIVFMIFSQRRRTKALQMLQSSLGIGDEVMTTSGMLGRITALDDTIATLEVSPGVSVRFNRRAVAALAPTQATGPTASAPNESDTDGPSDPTRITD